MTGVRGLSPTQTADRTSRRFASLTHAALCAALAAGCSSSTGPAGPQGVKGDPGPAATPSQIQAAVSMMTDLDVPALAGRPAAGYLKTSEWGRLLEGESAAMASLATAGVAEPLASSDAATASGGLGVRGKFNSGITGIIAGIDMTTLAGEPIAAGPALVEFRLMVTSTASATTIGRVRCNGTRADNATTFSSVRDVQPRHFQANSRWQTFGLHCEFGPGDVEQSIAVELTDDTVMNLSLDYVRVTPSPNPCPPGWWSIAGGRVCMESVMRAASPMITATTGAIAVCAAQQARVCTLADYQRACGAGHAPFGGVSGGWFGDHAGGDDGYHVWNVTACSPNSDGSPALGTDSRVFRCCW